MMASDFSMRAKWRALKSGCCGAPQKVLDRRDSVRDGRIVGVPSLWPRPGGVLQQHGLGVIRPSDGAANAVAGCWLAGLWRVVSHMPVQDNVTSERHSEHYVWVK